MAPTGKGKSSRRGFERTDSFSRDSSSYASTSATAYNGRYHDSNDPFPVYDGRSDRTHYPPPTAPPPSALNMDELQRPEGPFVQAFEADLRANMRLGMEMERREGSSKGVGRLIKWKGMAGGGATTAFDADVEDTLIVSASEAALAEAGSPNTDVEADGTDNRGLWVDRYSALLLLPSLDFLQIPTSQSHQSEMFEEEDGWSSIPSDAEDMFFFSGDEADEIDRKKKRRFMDEEREKRLNALKERDGPEEVVLTGMEDWGGDDEIPSEDIQLLMKHTLKALSSSPIPAVLEMRIIANHSRDSRFAFLKGRWKNTWETLKQDLEQQHLMEKEEQHKLKIKEKGLGMLGGYGDSDEESGSDDETLLVEPTTLASESASPLTTTAPEDASSSALDHTTTGEDDLVVDDEAKKRRLEKAKEWAAKRRKLDLYPVSTSSDT